MSDKEQNTHCCHSQPVQPAHVTSSAGDLAGKYICPMCPGVVSDVPAPCPVCGMALEQVLAPGTMPSADAGDDPEYRDMRRRFIVSLVFTLPLLVVAMGGMFVGKHLPWLELLLAAPVCLWGGYPFFQRAWRSLQTGNLNMFTLIGLGVFVAFGYSLVATIAPGIFPASFRDASGGVAVYYEAAATIVTLVLFGQVIELRAGEVSHFQALATALSGTVGLGNIAGVAVAVSLGGPGATFWMIAAGFFCISAKFTECALGVKYREEFPDGRVSGGPMYYLSKGLAEKGKAGLGKVLAGLFAIMCIFGCLGAGNMF